MNKFPGLADLINYHLRLHGGMELIDIYKLVYQSVYGPEHLIHSAAPHSTSNEMKSPDVDFLEPLIEPISLNTTVCRINLRVAGKRGISADLIERAVHNSARKFNGSQNALSRLWNQVGDVLAKLEKQFSVRDLEQVTESLRESGFPPVHHSPAYKKVNRPAYRVLMRNELERFMPPLPNDCR